jgi:hypothetical protein
MAFPGKFELYDEAIEHPDGGYVIKYERYDYQVDIGIKEGKECFTVRYTEDDVEEHILEHNNAEYISLFKTSYIIKADLGELPDSTKLKKQFEIISEYRAIFIYWFRNSGNEVPVIPRASRMTKESEFLQLFDRLFSDLSTTEEIVRENLYNEEYFKNPSAYMAKVRKTFDLTIDEIKSHPGFAFLDPKNTARS